MYIRDSQLINKSIYILQCFILLNFMYVVFTFAYKVSNEFVESILSKRCLSKASNAANTLVVTVPKKCIALIPKNKYYETSNNKSQFKIILGYKETTLNIFCMDFCVNEIIVKQNILYLLERPAIYQYTIFLQLFYFSLLCNFQHTLFVFYNYSYRTLVVQVAVMVILANYLRENHAKLYQFLYRTIQDQWGILILWFGWWY